VSATILAASTVAGLAQDSGFTHAFAVSAGVAVCAGVVAALIPSARQGRRGSALDEMGAASPLGDPALAQEEF
jgi:hypothetical protein